MHTATHSAIISAARPENLEVKSPHQSARQFPPLEQVTKPNLTTAELAYYSNMAAQTWRVKACYDNAPDGLRPLRVCGKLAWPTVGAKKLLGVAPTQTGYSTLEILACISGVALLILVSLTVAPATAPKPTRTNFDNSPRCAYAGVTAVNVGAVRDGLEAQAKGVLCNAAPITLAQLAGARLTNESVYAPVADPSNTKSILNKALHALENLPDADAARVGFDSIMLGFMSLQGEFKNV